MKIYLLKLSEYNEEYIYNFGYAIDENGILSIAKKYAVNLLGGDKITAKIDWTENKVHIYNNDELVLTAFIVALDLVESENPPKLSAEENDFLIWTKEEDKETAIYNGFNLTVSIGQYGWDFNASSSNIKPFEGRNYQSLSAAKIAAKKIADAARKPKQS